ncbi:unnamed protein product [Pleuronectes platessa]|uniref:Plus3 domain-containing protein n=1 Tax=Pleuronectes platessa TaxID=8262 RepID=A0A9N7YB58_PLEPL|nr:unnamed protein product [Pleuronectes platessa]
MWWCANDSPAVIWEKVVPKCAGGDSSLTPLDGLTAGPGQVAIGLQYPFPVSHHSSLLKALDGAQKPSIEMLPAAKRKFLLRYAGTKARGEGTQPALPPEELKRICLSFNTLEKWCHMPFFATTVTGCFVRVATEASISGPSHCVSEIVSVMETKNVYQIGSKRTNLVFNLRHAGKDQIVTLSSASNQKFRIREFMQWKLEMIAAGMTFPTPEMIASKEKSIKKALDHIFTEEDMDFIDTQQSRFPAARLNVVKREPQLLDKQSAARSHGDGDMVKRKFLLRSAGTKARGEGTQPAFPPEELKRICLSYNTLEKWCHMPFFATTVTGCFVRVLTEASISDPPHCVAEIVSVMESKNVYQFGSKRTNLVFNLRHAGKDQILTLTSASNQEFTIREFLQWKLEMIAAGIKVPTPERIASKEKSLKEALDHIFTEEDMDFIDAQQSRFPAARLNVVKREVQLPDKQSAARSHGDGDMLKRKLLVAGAASAGSGRSAGIKCKRQVEHGKGPEEKKARGEGTQPALPPEELKRICLSYNTLEKWCHMPFFATTVTGCFVRVLTEASISGPTHCVAEIVSVMETKNVYQIRSKRTNLVVKLRYAGKDQIVTLSSASNQEFTIREFMLWKLEMTAAGIKVPTPERIASKEKSLKEALDHIFTEEDMDFIDAQKNRFPAARLNVAKRKLQLPDKHSAARGQGDDYRVKRPRMN